MKLKFIILFIFSSIIFTCTVSQAAFEMLSFNARSSGMADTFVATCNDTNALIFNPAGLGQITIPQLSAQYTRLYVGLTDDSKIADAALSYLQPIRNIGTLGVGYFSRSLSSLYGESLINLGFGKNISPTTLLGINAKLLSIKTDASSTALSKTSVSQISIDAGILYQQEALSLGLSISDVNQPNLNLTSQDNKLPFTLRAGGTYQLDEEGNFLISLEGTHRDKENRVGLGLEKWLSNNMFGFRGGVLDGLGGREFMNLTLGFGLRLKNNLAFDYALIYPLKGIKDTSGSHRLSLSLKFGQEEKREKPKKKKIEEKKEEEEKEQGLERFETE